MRENLKYIAQTSLVLCLLHVAGCAQQPVPAPPVTARESGGFNPPQIISSRPRQDAAAYAAADEQLTSADWQSLLELGPRPIWEQLTGRRHHGRQCGDPRGAVPPLEVASTSETTGDEGRSPATRPATTRPATAVVLDEADLPAEVIPLPADKLRIIWALRNFGGTTVKSARDAVTAHRTVELAQPDLAPLVTVLTQTLGAGGAVSALPQENTIVITCDKAMRTPVLSLLNDLDHPPRQVEIAAKIFEVSHDFDFQQGTELVLNRLASQGGQALVSTFSAKRFLDAMNSASSAPVQGSVLRLMQVFASAGVSVDVSFQLLSDAGLIQVVSEPRMTVAVGQTGYMLAGQEIPIQSTNVVNNVLQIGTSYKPVGVQLYITPEAAGPARVKLHTVSIVSAVAGFNAVQSMEGGAAPVQNPVIDSREAETAVTVTDRSTLVISGLRMIRTTTREEKIPGLGDVPVLGWLFKNHRSQQEQTDLYFFITPTML